MSPDEFRKLLQRKGASAQCPVCGAEDWRGLDAVIDLPVRVTGRTRQEAQVRIPGFDALAPSCGRCGHVRLIDLRLLEAPVEQESAGAQESASEQDGEPPPDVRSGETSQAGRSDHSGQRLTNLWGQPISKRRGRSS
jgi:hypothetical protein